MHYAMNARLPGPGNCMAPDFTEADAKAARLANQVEAMTAEVIAEWLEDRDRFSEYACTISDTRWEAFERAIAVCDDIEACRIYRAALADEMKGDAEREAIKRVAAINACREMEAARDRAEARGAV